MLDSYFDMLKGYFSFKGRVGRHEYWSGLLITLLIICVLLWFAEKIEMLNFLPGLFAIFMAIPTITSTVRRLHDVGRSGWWALLFLLPVVGWICLFIYLIQQTPDEKSMSKIERKKAERKEAAPRLRRGYMG